MATTKTYIALHTVTLRRNKRTQNIKPGTALTDLTKEEVDRLLKFKAVRVATAKDLASDEEVSDEDDSGKTERDELLARAEALELSVPKNIGTAKLKERIEEAEKANDGL